MDKMLAAWIETALEWNITAAPDWERSSHNGEDVNKANATYIYYSPFRPINWPLGNIGTHFVLPGTVGYVSFIYCVNPLPAERIYKWELVPVSPAAIEAVRAEVPKEED
jgi:hypothetical protein